MHFRKAEQHASCRSCGHQINKGTDMVYGRTTRAGFAICIPCYIEMYNTIMTKCDSAKDYQKIKKEGTQLLHIKSSDPIIKQLCLNYIEEGK